MPRHRPTCTKERKWKWQFCVHQRIKTTLCWLIVLSVKGKPGARQKIVQNVTRRMTSDLTLSFPSFPIISNVQKSIESRDLMTALPSNRSDRVSILQLFQLTQIHHYIMEVLKLPLKVQKHSHERVTCPQSTFKLLEAAHRHLETYKKGDLLLNKVTAIRKPTEKSRLFRPFLQFHLLHVKDSVKRIVTLIRLRSNPRASLVKLKMVQ